MKDGCMRLLFNRLAIDRAAVYDKNVENFVMLVAW